MNKLVDSKLMKKMFYNLDERLASSDDKVVKSLLKNKKRRLFQRHSKGVVCAVLLCRNIIYYSTFFDK